MCGGKIPILCKTPYFQHWQLIHFYQATVLGHVWPVDGPFALDSTF